MSQEIELCQRPDGKVIRGRIFMPEGMQKRFPTVIFCHGFGGNYKELAHHGQGFAKAGICCVMFDFCGGGPAGISDGSMLEMSVRTEHEDLVQVLETVRRKSFVDPKRLFLMGESQGGFVAASVGEEKAREIAGLILWYPAFVIPDDVRKVCENGIPDAYEVFGLQIGKVYATDALSLDPYRNMASFHRPVLIIHGDQDGIVPIAYSYRAKETYPDVRLEVIQGADHGFNGADSVHAWELSRDFIKGMEKKGSVFSKIMNLRHLISIPGKG